MSTEVYFDSSSIQLLLLIGLIILVGVYFYYENYKLKNQLYEFEYKLNKLTEFIDYDSKKMNISNNFENIPNELINNPNEIIQENTISIQKDILNNEIKNDEIKNDEIKHDEIKNDEIKNDENWLNIHQQMSNNDIVKHTEKELNDEIIDEIIDISEKNQSIETVVNEDHELSDINLDDMLKDIIIDEENKEMDYSKMTVSQLKNILIEKNLPVSGNKTKLIQRILDNNE